MATSLLLLLDDIASVLDDVATMTKVAATKTAGVVGDDLAVNAQQVVGIGPDRELAVVWRVAVGSAANKAVLVPMALAISWLVPWAIPPLLVAGGIYLCFEGAEKVLHAIQRPQQAAGAEVREPLSPGGEAEKIRGAIRTDFILSAEIIVITLGVVAGEALLTQVGVLAAVAVLMTGGVYGAVAAIVKIDDAGLWLATHGGQVARWFGRGIVRTAPWLMHALAVVGTAAMFLVGGGIVVHQIPAVHHVSEIVTTAVAARFLRDAGWAAAAVQGLAHAAVGCGLGGIAVVAAAGIRSLRRASVG